jgi:hypothetical protein
MLYWSTAIIYYILDHLQLTKLYNKDVYVFKYCYSLKMTIDK